MCIRACFLFLFALLAEKQNCSTQQERFLRLSFFCQEMEASKALYAPNSAFIFVRCTQITKQQRRYRVVAGQLCAVGFFVYFSLCCFSHRSCLVVFPFPPFLFLSINMHIKKEKQKKRRGKKKRNRVVLSQLKRERNTVYA